MKMNSNSQLINEMKKILISLVLFGCIVMIMLYAMAFMVQNNYMDLDNSAWIGYISILLGTFISNVIWIRAERAGMIFRIITTACIMILLWLLIGMLIFDGLASMGWGSAIAIVIGSLTTLLIPYMKSSKRTFKKYRSR